MSARERLRNLFVKQPGLQVDVVDAPARTDPALSLADWSAMFGYEGLKYPVMPQFSLRQTPEEIQRSFSGYVEGIYKSNGVVFACMAVRQLLFSEARFRFRREINGRPGDLFGSPALVPLERPWTNGTTGDLLLRAIQDADLGGNFFAVRVGSQMRRLQPDWTTVIAGSRTSDDPNAPDVEILGYVYSPGGPHSGSDPVKYLPEEVVHFMPTPDPACRFLGMSPLTPVIREIQSDSSTTTHKLKFFQNGATPNIAVSMDPEVDEETFTRFIELFREEHEGAANAYKTLFLGGGAKVEVVGADMQQIDFKSVQGHGETRIAAALGVPPVIVGLSEGLEAATYSNYAQARRRFADGTMRPLWRNMAASLARVINVPPGAELWYDDRDIPFLQEDVKDRAEILSTDASTAVSLINGGYEPDAVIQAVSAGDLRRLIGKHTGLLSVQLQKPGQDGAPAAEKPGAAPGALPAGKTQPQLPPGNGNGDSAAGAGRDEADVVRDAIRRAIETRFPSTGERHG